MTVSTLNPVDDRWSVSVAHATVDPKGTTHKTTPAGVAAPHGRGLAESKGHDRLMHSVEPTSDTPPPPPCPSCGGRAGQAIVQHADHNLGTTEAYYLCDHDHLYSLRWATWGDA